MARGTSGPKGRRAGSTSHTQAPAHGSTGAPRSARGSGQREERCRRRQPQWAHRSSLRFVGTGPGWSRRRGATMKAILIAEGDERESELFAYLFADEGWSVTMYRDGKPAAAALGGSAAYDAVLVSN